MAIALGGTIRTRRRQLRLTQAALAQRIGLDQSRISQIECGRGGRATLETWVAIGVALDRPLAVTYSRPLGATREPTDAGHLAIQEFLLRLAHTTGRTATFELPTRPTDPSRSIDVCVPDPRARVLFIEEAWNTFGDLGAAVRTTNRKLAEANDLAATIDDGPPYRVAAVWVVRATATNRELVRRYPAIFASAFPGSSLAWVRALTTREEPPTGSGVVWFDSATGTVHAWRRGRP